MCANDFLILVCQMITKPESVCIDIVSCALEMMALFRLFPAIHKCDQCAMRWASTPKILGHGAGIGPTLADVGPVAARCRVLSGLDHYLVSHRLRTQNT